MKKLLFGLCLILSAQFTHAQNGLESIIVEKYYVSNAADATGSIGALPVGSVTYRVYVDMLPGYKLQAVYGVPTHSMTLSTTTTFFNNEDRGATTPTYTKAQARSNSVMLDSWLSVGGACTGNFGIIKSEDDVVGGGATVVNNTVPPILQNNDPTAGIPLTTQDGLYLGTTQSVTIVGFTTAELSVLDATSGLGSILTTSNGSWASLNGATGPIPATNKVLIAQITTEGVFHYELNIQIGTPGGGSENYVAQNPVGTEITIPSLIGTYGGSNTPPTVNITSPSNGASFLTGAVVAIAANASDADGTVASVEFFVDAVSVGIDNSAPYTANYTSVTGTHLLTAKATDNNGAQTTSAAISINVSSNSPPTVNITSPANGANFITGANIPISATASDNGSVASVEFFVDGLSIGIDNSSPYSANYTGVLGSHTLTAEATDNLGAQTTSAAISISVGNNLPPTVSITAPANGAIYNFPASVTLTATAADADGTVSLVQFYVNGILVGSDATSPYSFSWTSVIGIASITAKATDNLGSITTSAAILITIANPNARPYMVVSSTNTCVADTFCQPVAAVDPVNNVIGYDIVMHYNNSKLQPTGVITVANSLINPTFVDVASSINSISGTINISLYFNTNAPANTRFTGTGNLICVEFIKTVGFNSIDTAQISIPMLQESYINGVTSQPVDSGKYITYKDSIFHGALRFWTNNSPIKYNAANPNQYLVTNINGTNNLCNNPSLVTVQPDTSGNFSYNILNGQKIAIKKDIPGSTSVQPVINGFDALLTRKILISDPSFTPTVFQAIAMDVNMDGVISAGDASQINQRAVLMIPEFKQSWNYDSLGNSNGQLSKDWLFIDSAKLTTDLSYRISTTFPLNDGIGFSKARVPIVPFCLPVTVTGIASCPKISNETYKGVLIGDVDGNYGVVLPNNMFKEDASDRIVFDMTKAVLSGNFIDIPVYISSTTKVNAIDFSLKFNEGKFAYNSVIVNATNFQALANLNSSDRTLRFTSSSNTDIDISNSPVSVRFMLNNKNFNESDLNFLEGFINGNRVGVEVIGTGNSSGHAKEESVIVYPNPANNLLNVIVSEEAVVQLLDINSRLIVFEGTVNANQKKELDIRNLSNGIYMMRIYNENFVSVKKIIIEN